MIDDAPETLTPCPACRYTLVHYSNDTRAYDPNDCDLCRGAMRVVHSIAKAWIDVHEQRRTEPPP